MKAGQLNSRVTIQQLTAGQDAIGQPVQTWSTLATVWANIKQPSGMESIRADRETSVLRASIRIRRRTDVTAAMRVVLGATVYQIQAVLSDEQHKEYLDLSCEVAA